MIKSRDAFAMALAMLRQDLRNGALRPGRPLLVVELAQRLRISPTPVREALSRLTGEGLVQDERGRGFHARRLDASDVTELYQIHHALADVGISRRRADAVSAGGRLEQTKRASSPKAGRLQKDEPRAATEQFWVGVVGFGESQILSTVHSMIADQLAVPRLIEPQVFQDLDVELKHLVGLAAEDDWDALAYCVIRYHERRAKMASSLAAAIRETFCL